MSGFTKDSTAELTSAVSMSRCPQDDNNNMAERSYSALDRRNRFTYTAVYDRPWLSTHENELLKNALVNWELSGMYTPETGA